MGSWLWSAFLTVQVAFLSAAKTPTQLGVILVAVAGRKVSIS